MAKMQNRRDDTGCCSRIFLKSIMIVFNTFFWLSGVAFLLIGLGSFFFRHHYISLLSSELFPITTYLFMGIGGVILFMGCMGCLGTLREIRCCLTFYAFMLMAVLLAEACAGVIAYMYESAIHEELERNLNRTISRKYSEDAAVTDAVDHMQEAFKCCGSTSFTEWEFSNWATHKSVGDGNLVPPSCCISPNATCAANTESSTIFQTGCIKELEQYIRFHLILIGGVALGLSILQIFGIFFSCCLALKIKEFQNL